MVIIIVVIFLIIAILTIFIQDAVNPPQEMFWIKGSGFRGNPVNKLPASRWLYFALSKYELCHSFLLETLRCDAMGSYASYKWERNVSL